MTKAKDTMKIKQMSDHKPCPFCGGTTISHGGDDTWTGAWCEDCGAMGPNQYGKKEWNDRELNTYYTADKTAAHIRELEAELAFYKGFHDGVCKTGTHVIVPVKPSDRTAIGHGHANQTDMEQ